MGSWYNTVGAIGKLSAPCIERCGNSPIKPEFIDFVPIGTQPNPTKVREYAFAVAQYSAKKAAWDSCMSRCKSEVGASLSQSTPTRTDGSSSHDTAELVPLQQGKADSVGGSTGLSTGAKIGIGVGIVALVAVFYFMRKGKK